MRVSCVLDLKNLGAEKSDVIVFPEGISRIELQRAGSAHAASIVVGAFEENGYSRGLLLHRGQSRIEYLKVESDHLHTKGSRKTRQRPIYDRGDMCVGVLICMDVDHVEFSRAVVDAVKSSNAGKKLICVPADMAPHWFPGETLLGPMSEGVHVAVSNGMRTHGKARRKSFVTDTRGRIIATQKGDEALHVQLPEP